MSFTRILNLENLIHLLKIQAFFKIFFLYSFYNKNQSHNQITDYQELLQELLFSVFLPWFHWNSEYKPGRLFTERLPCPRV